MLVELTVQNLAVIEETRLTFTPGLNVVTGETGAGKSLLVDALEFVLGGAADRDLMRAGAASARVEAVFATAGEPQVQQALRALDVEIDDEGLVVLAREVHREGRTISRLNGRAVPVGIVRAVGDALVDIHGQGAHLSLLDPSYQRRVLDDCGGLAEQRRAVAGAIADVERIRQELLAIASNARDAEQKRDLLAFQVNEIDAAGLARGEEEALVRERDVLVSAESIREACAAAYGMLREEGSNAADLIAEAVQALRRAPDPTGVLGAQIEALESASAQIEEAARETRSFGERVESDPTRLAEIEERIELLRRLKRKYGDSDVEVIAFADEARRQLEGIDNAEERRDEAARALSGAMEQAGKLAWELSEARSAAARSLSAAVEAELGEVGLDGAAFGVEIERTQASDGLPAPDEAHYAYSSDGIDRISFSLRANPGEDMKPLATVASGGETSRMMLALNSALQATSGAPTLVFDEIDAGIGGRTGTVVGAKLWTVARRAQTLCVTHLPQIAAYADRHFRVDKAVYGERTYASAEVVEDEQRVAELAGMLGDGDSASLSEAAREMLKDATRSKTGV